MTVNETTADGWQIANGRTSEQFPATHTRAGLVSDPFAIMGLIFGIFKMLSQFLENTLI